MTKLIIPALVALAALLPALPVAAASTHQSVPYCSGGDDIEADSDMVAMKLRSKGVAATSVEEWNGCIRAFITNADGSQAMAFFDPETLQQIG